MILQWLLLDTPEVIAQVSLELDALLEDVGEVDEEARAHVALQLLDLFVIDRNVIPHEQVAVLQQSTAANLFGSSRRYELVGEMIKSLVKVAIHRLTDNRRVEVLGDRQLRAVVE